MTRAEKRQRVFELLQKDPSLPNTEIGRRAGVSHTAVANMRRELASGRPETCNSPNETFKPKEAPGTESFKPGEVAAESFKPKEVPGTESFRPKESVVVETFTPSQKLQLQVPSVSAVLPSIPLDEIAAQIPREQWRGVGLALVRGDALVPDVEDLVADVPAAARSELGAELLKLFRQPVPRPGKPRAKRAGSGNPRHHSNDLRLRVLDLRRKGVQFQDIAAALSIPASSCRAIVQKDAPDLLARKLSYSTAEQRAKVIELRAQGLLDLVAWIGR